MHRWLIKPTSELCQDLLQIVTFCDSVAARALPTFPKEMLPFQVTWLLARFYSQQHLCHSITFLDGCPETAGTHLAGLQTEQSALGEFEDNGCWSQRLNMHALKTISLYLLHGISIKMKWNNVYKWLSTELGTQQGADKCQKTELCIHNMHSQFMCACYKYTMYNLGKQIIYIFSVAANSTLNV